MLGSNPSADSVASTDPGGMLWHPPIGRGTKALNPGGAGAKPPQASPATNLPSEARAPSHNACEPDFSSFEASAVPYMLDNMSVSMVFY